MYMFIWHTFFIHRQTLNENKSLKVVFLIFPFSHHGSIDISFLIAFDECFLKDTILIRKRFAKKKIITWSVKKNKNKETTIENLQLW